MKIGIGHNLGFHDHALVELPTVENSGNYGVVHLKIVIVDSRYYLRFFGEIS